MSSVFVLVIRSFLVHAGLGSGRATCGVEGQNQEEAHQENRGGDAAPASTKSSSLLRSRLQESESASRGRGGDSHTGPIAVHSPRAKVRRLSSCLVLWTRSRTARPETEARRA